MIRSVLLLLCGGVLLAVSHGGASAAAAPNVTLVLVNGRIWTGDPAHPDAEGIAIAGERIVSAGTNDEIRRLAGGATTVDLQGQFVTPGFIDSHVHFLEGGFRLTSVQLRDAKTREEFVRRIKAFAGTVPPGTWIVGGDWDHTLWGGELPRRDWIDAVTPGHPVWINRLDGHMALANSAALRAAGLGDAIADVPGGEIVRDAAGRPTGLFKDNAMDLVGARVPPPSAAQNDRALEAAMTYRRRAGGDLRSSHGHVGRSRRLRTRAGVRDD